MTNYDASNHYEEGILRIERYRPGHIWTAVLNDADQGYLYIKRFPFEVSAKKQRFIGENVRSALIVLSDEPGARFEVTFGGADEFRGSMVIDAEEFIAVKSFKAKGKRISNYAIGSVVEIEPREIPVADNVELPAGDDVVEETPVDEKSDDEVRDEINGQQHLF